MTREELDRLHARAMSAEPLDGPLVTCPELLALIAQARRAIELEERISEVVVSAARLRDERDHYRARALGIPQPDRD